MAALGEPLEVICAAEEEAGGDELAHADASNDAPTRTRRTSHRQRQQNMHLFSLLILGDDVQAMHMLALAEAATPTTVHAIRDDQLQKMTATVRRWMFAKHPCASVALAILLQLNTPMPDSLRDASFYSLRISSATPSIEQSAPASLLSEAERMELWKCRLELANLSSAHSPLLRADHRYVLIAEFFETKPAALPPHLASALIRSVRELNYNPYPASRQEVEFVKLLYQKCHRFLSNYGMRVKESLMLDFGGACHLA